MGEIIGVISIKGGVGKTTVVSSFGSVLANEFNKKVLVVDANFSAPNLGLHLGMVDPEVSLHDVLQGHANVKDAIYHHEAGFDVLAGALVSGKIDPFRIRQRLKMLKYDYDYILMDSSPTLNDEILATMVSSDRLLVVTSPDYPTLSCTLGAIRLAKEQNVPIIGLILNKTRGKSFELSFDEIEEASGVPILAVLPDDVNVLAALSMTTPLPLYKGGSEVSVELKKLAGALTGVKYSDKRFMANFRKMLKPSVRKVEVNRLLLEKGHDQHQH